MAVNAPFRFARISRWVHEPAWGKLASHDIPFADGLSGTAIVTLRTITPLLIGGRRQDAANGQPGRVWPYKVGDKYAIPPSTMQGMCRSILEIAAFGRLGPFIDARKFSIRDMSKSTTANVHYKSRLSETLDGVIHSNSKAGWLVKSGEKTTITPCKISRIHVNDVMDLRNQYLAALKKNLDTGTPFQLSGDAKSRYSRFLQNLGGKDYLNAKFNIGVPDVYNHQLHTRNPIQIEYSRCVPDSSGVNGTLVLTGKPPYRRGADPLGGGLKKREFVFHAPDRSAAALTSGGLVVDKDVWDAFAFFHEKQKGRPINPNWNFWESEFKAGQPVPVIYWEEGGKVTTFGMAFAFKAAHTHSSHELLNHSFDGHTTDIKKAELDFAHLIFGIAAEGNGGKGLKRRVWFGTGTTSYDGNHVNFANSAILLSPKPSYAGIYVRQQGNGDIIPGNEPLATYSPIDVKKFPQLNKKHLTEPELAGVKIWPASHPKPTEITLPLPAVNNADIQTNLHPVPHDVTFTVPLTFHNLRPVELGALLWALSYGEEAAFGDEPASLHHRLGMGKPYGLGEVAINVALNVDENIRAAKEFVDGFTNHMNEAYPLPTASKGWNDSLQVKALLKAANPVKNTPLAQGVQPYMELRGHEDTYVGEKDRRNGRQGYLTDYVTGHEIPRSGTSRPAAPTKPPPEPVVGARIECTANPHQGRRGIITRIDGVGDFANFHIKLDNGVVLKRFRTTFKVVGSKDGE